jgi:hypothetical protein
MLIAGALLGAAAVGLAGLPVHDNRGASTGKGSVGSLIALVMYRAWRDSG